MKLYRIISLTKDLKISRSPFVFLKEDAEFRCKSASENFKNAKYIMALSQNHTTKEIRCLYPDDLSIQELKEIVKE